MGATRSFCVLAAATERLDRFLADQLGISRTRAARLVAGGDVRVNGEPVRRSHTPARGDTVEVTFSEKAPPREIAPHHIDVSVVFEDDSMLVVDKPAGLVVHPAPGHWQDTLVNALVSRGIRLSGGAGGRPGIVHRLDKDTSGLMIVAKDDEAHRFLSRAISRRSVTREYAALVWGHVDEEYLEIAAPIGRNPRDRKRMMVLAGGRAARSQVARVARFPASDLVAVRLATGRTHQIRVHLAHVGRPVVGDPVYGGGGARRISGPASGLAARTERSCPRQALHAARLVLKHPRSSETLDLRSDWPADLRVALATAAADDTLLDRPNVLDYLGFFGDRERWQR